MKEENFDKKIFRQCKACQEIRLKHFFKYAHIKKLSHYCVYCFVNKEYLGMIFQFKNIISKAENLFKEYGKEWLQHTDQYSFNINYLMKFDEEFFDFCIYCGNKFLIDEHGCEVYHIDHMNPLSFGGDISYENCIHVCPKCNLKKGNMSFALWLQKLVPEYKELSEKIYIRKHGYAPDQFVVSQETDMELSLQLEDTTISTLISYPIVKGEIKSIYSDIDYLKSIQDREIYNLKNYLISNVGAEIFNEAINLYDGKSKYYKKLKKYIEKEYLELY